MAYKVPNIQEVKRGLKEYKLTEDIFSEDSPKVRLTKRAILKCLTPGERSILLVYAECGSMRKTKDVLGSKEAITISEISRIKRKVKLAYQELANKHPNLGL